MATTRREAHRAATQREIVAAAWQLARSDGLAALTMRDLAELVGLRAPSVYTYFESKNAIFDAMFAEGYEAFLSALDIARVGLAATPGPADAQRMMHAFVAFCTDDPVRFQLLFQRTLPGFEPSAASFAVAVRAYETMACDLAALGVTDQAALDLWTAVATGLASQQIANDPGGSRWARLSDQAVDMLLHATAHRTSNRKD